MILYRVLLVSFLIGLALGQPEFVELRQKVSNINQQLKEQSRIAVLVDTSGSINSHDFEKMREFLANFAPSLETSNTDVTLHSFSAQVFSHISNWTRGDICNFKQAIESKFTISIVLLHWQLIILS